MDKRIKGFLLVLTGLLGVSFALHVLMLNLNDLPLFGNRLIGCYVFNYLIASITFILLYLFQKPLAGSLGFVFMGGSMIKFLLFFLLFYPSFNQDNDVSRLEFAAFFIPYTIALITEVIFLSKILNK